MLISTLFVALGGNGANFLQVAWGMLLIASITGLISFVLSVLVRSVGLAILGSMLVTELAFVLYLVSRVAYAERVNDHAAEESFLLPVIFVLVTGPTVLFSAIGFSRLAHRFWTSRRLPRAAAL